MSQWYLDPGQLAEPDYDEGLPEQVPAYVLAPQLPDVDNYGTVVKHFTRLGMHATVGAWFFTGGQDRFNKWSDENYSDFAKTFLAKSLPKQVQLEHSGSVTIDDVILSMGDEYSPGVQNED